MRLSASIAIPVYLYLRGILIAQNLPQPGGNPEHFADIEVTGHIFKPKELAPPDVTKLQVPEGFRVEKVADHLGNARKRQRVPCDRPRAFGN